MTRMFCGCKSLLYLDLSRFFTGDISSMESMFEGCSSLTSLDLTNFANNGQNMSRCFYNCTNLKYINIKQFYEKEGTNEIYYLDMFYGTSDFLVYCMNKIATEKDKIRIQLTSKKCSTEYCSEDWESKVKKILNGTDQCLDDCSSISTYEYNGICYPECPKGTKSSNKNIFLCEDILNNEENVVNNFIMKIKDGSMDLIIEELINENNNKTDYLVKYDNIIIQITPLLNDENSNDKSDNISSIYIDKNCENILKVKYNITKNVSLILIKSDYFITGINIPFIRYDVINPDTKEILDINLCENSEIEMNIPVKIDESILYKYDPNNNFYNDICHSYNNGNGVDLTLFDRKIEFNYYNYSLCPNKCNFDGYNNFTKKVSCKCGPETQISNLNLDEIIPKDKLLNNFIDIKSISNFNIIKCLKVEIIKQKFQSNIGSYILIVIIVIFIILCVLFYLKEYQLIIKQVENIIKSKKENKNTNIKIQNNNINKIDTINNIEQINKIENKIIKKKKKKKKKSKKIILDNTNNFSNLSISKHELNTTIPNKNNNKFIDSEINSFSYDEAMKNDKRSFCEYYASLIKTKHILISPFTKSDYNPNIIKMSLFFYSFALLYFVNALFFTDVTMHKIYEDGGIFNFAYSLPKIIYSFIISTVINALIKFLALPDNDIIKIRQKNNYINAKKNLPKYKKKLKIKFALYFMICFILLIFFWCYLFCFGAIYPNTQIYLLKDTLISFGLSFLYPFVVYLFPSGVRIALIRKPEYIYKLSKLLQLL